MPLANLVNRTVEAAPARAKRYEVFDERLKGFSLRVSPKGVRTWYVVYRANEGGRTESKKRLRLGTYPTMGADEARRLARDHLAGVQKGDDPAAAKAKRRETVTVAVLADAFLAKKGLKKRTFDNYADILDRLVLPAVGHLKVDAVKPEAVAKMHADWSHTPFQANRMLAVLSSMYGWGSWPNTFVPEGFNPTKKVPRNKEPGRSCRLTSAEMARLGAAIRQAETVGVPWKVTCEKPTVKHLGKNPGERRTVVNAGAAAAIRLLIFTGARLREVLNLRWSEVDLDYGALTLSDSKTGGKLIVLNGPAINVLEGLPRVSQFVIPGEPRQGPSGEPIDKPRSDLQRPWTAITKLAGLEHIRLHDLRHSFATKALSEGKELLIVSKLLGHARVATTQKYIHLATKPMKKASNSVGSRIEKEMGEERSIVAKAGRGRP